MEEVLELNIEIYEHISNLKLPTFVNDRPNIKKIIFDTTFPQLKDKMNKAMTTITAA